MPEMSVIVVNWNGKHFLETCLLALRRQTFRDFETFLVDNGSEDGSVEYVREHFPDVSVLPLGRNLGFAAANNAGYEQARGELIVLLNNDTEADPHWLEEIHKASQKFPAAESFASKMLYFDDRNRIDNCGFWISLAGLSQEFGRNELDGAAWADFRWVFGASAGACGYCRRMLRDIGLFDPDFFMTYEDLDLSFRAQLRGYKCIFVPRAIVYHRYRATMNNFPACQVFYSQRNIECVYVKNMPLGLILRSAPERFLYELGSAVYFSRKHAGLAFLQAKGSAIRQLPALLRKRREIQKRKSVTHAQLRSVMLDNWFRPKWRKFISAWFGRPEKTLSPTQPHS